MEVEKIENSIRLLKEIKNSEKKIRHFGLIADDIKVYFMDTKTLYFDRGLILSFFDRGYFPKTTENRYIKGILTALKDKGIIKEDIRKKTYKRVRNYSLKSRDFNSYMALMKDNGFKFIDYFIFVVDKNGIPRRKKVGTTTINGQPSFYFEYSQLRQTIPRRKQGVLSYGNKSIAIEGFNREVKTFKVVQ